MVFPFCSLEIREAEGLCHIAFLWILQSRHTEHKASVCLPGQEQMVVLVKSMKQEAAAANLPSCLLQCYEIAGQDLKTRLKLRIPERLKGFPALYNRIAW